MERKSLGMRLVICTPILSFLSLSFRYIIHLWYIHHDGTWENQSSYTYYVELVLELVALCVDFVHHVHMLLWANMFLSVASLILLMKLRFLYQVCVCRLCTYVYMLSSVGGYVAQNQHAHCNYPSSPGDTETVKEAS